VRRIRLCCVDVTARALAGPVPSRQPHQGPHRRLPRRRASTELEGVDEGRVTRPSRREHGASVDCEAVLGWYFSTHERGTTMGERCWSTHGA